MNPPSTNSSLSVLHQVAEKLFLGIEQRVGLNIEHMVREARNTVLQLLDQAYIDGVLAKEKLDQEGEHRDRAMVAYDLLASTGLVRDPNGTMREPCLRVLEALATPPKENVEVLETRMTYWKAKSEWLYADDKIRESLELEWSANREYRHGAYTAEKAAAQVEIDRASAKLALLGVEP